MSMPPSATTDAPAGPAVAHPRLTIVRSRPSRFRLLAGDPKLWLGLGLLSSVLLMAAFAPAVTSQTHPPICRQIDQAASSRIVQQGLTVQSGPMPTDRPEPPTTRPSFAASVRLIRTTG